MSALASSTETLRLVLDGSPLAEDSQAATQELTRLEKEWDFYRSLDSNLSLIGDLAARVDNRIQALFRPFDSQGLMNRVNQIWDQISNFGSFTNARDFHAQVQALHDIDQGYIPENLRPIVHESAVMAEAMEYLRNGYHDEALAKLRGLPPNDRVTQLQGLVNTQRQAVRNQTIIQVFRAVALNEVQKIIDREEPNAAGRYGQELNAAISRLQSSLDQGKTLIEAIDLERQSTPQGPFVEMYLERGLGNFASQVSSVNQREQDFYQQVMDFAEGYLEHFQGLYVGAQLIGKHLEENAYIGNRARDMLGRIPAEADIQQKIQFLQNLGLITAESNRAVLKTGYQAMVFAATDGLGSMAAEGASALLASRGFSEAISLTGGRLAHTAAMGAVTPLLSPGAEHLTGQAYLSQFTHMFGLMAALGIKNSLMQNVGSKTLQYAGTIGTMTAYDYATQPGLSRLPFTLNLAHSIGSDLQMRAGQVLPHPRSFQNIHLPELSNFKMPSLDSQESRMALLASAAASGGCEMRSNSVLEGLVSLVGAGAFALLLRRLWVGRSRSSSAKDLHDEEEVLLPQMLHIPGGEFVMGSNRFENTQPVRWVEISPFKMSKTPVTNEQFGAYLSDPEYNQFPFAIFGRNKSTNFTEVVDRGRNQEELERRIAVMQENPDLFFEIGRDPEGGFLILGQAKTELELLQQRKARSEEGRQVDPNSIRTLKPFNQANHEDWQVERVIPENWTPRGGPDHPAVKINYWQALAYADSLGMRLPTEAEWEYATGPMVRIQKEIQKEQKPNPPPEGWAKIVLQDPLDDWADWIQGPLMGDNPEPEDCWGRYENFVHGLDIFANPQDPKLMQLREGAPIGARKVFPTLSGIYNDEEIWSSVIEKRSGTRSVTEGKSNEYGLVDMGGNVWEWVMDGHQGSYNGLSDRDPIAPTTIEGLGVLRGGSWFDDFPDFFRAAFRNFYHPSDAFNDGGFRVVAVPQD